ncbi:hypothetical protein Ddye_029869 [Dipteronia dyeriana]|uniref:Endopeptidase S2P n=1 Tax=Dipteronia dyeriana TaxID=168575 RepID=A0AAD9TFD3_9ROSI|nr:hypothetical protein Ddye_029869 [Dipteronia dyeriana]
MEGRRLRRFGRRRQPPSSSLLPVIGGGETASSDIAITVSCFYCDFKIRVLNEALYRFGRRHATWLRVWFSIGVGFSLTLVLGVSFLLLWSLLHRNSIFFSGFGFGFGSSTSISLAGAFNILLSTLISVSLHEFGHATAAASEGIRVEYIAVFIAVLFPGALVAFNHDFLDALPRLAALRVYCAGIWHNAACCAVCGLALLLMPLIFSPFYIHGEGLMVLDVPSTSPLSGYLSPGDVIVSLDGVHIHDEQDWMEMVALLDKRTLQGPNYSEYKGLEAVDGRKGYCVPNSVVEESKKIRLVDNQSACPDDFSAFATVHCFNTSMPGNVSSDDGQPDKRESRYCLNAKDIVKLNICGNGWATPLTNESNCMCSKDESCSSPVQFSGLIWVEIAYSRPYSLECLQRQSNLASDSSNNSIMEDYCGGTFVFVGDVISMAHSLRLTAYRPRSSSAFGAILPNALERSLMCTFYVSLALALLNSLPVSCYIFYTLLKNMFCSYICRYQPAFRWQNVKFTLIIYRRISSWDIMGWRAGLGLQFFPRLHLRG